MDAALSTLPSSSPSAFAHTSARHQKPRVLLGNRAPNRRPPVAADADALGVRHHTVTTNANPLPKPEVLLLQGRDPDCRHATTYKSTDAPVRWLDSLVNSEPTPAFDLKSESARQREAEYDVLGDDEIELWMREADEEEEAEEEGEEEEERERARKRRRREAVAVIPPAKRAKTKAKEAEAGKEKGRGKATAKATAKGKASGNAMGSGSKGNSRRRRK